MANNKTVHEPLFHIAKRDNIKLWHTILIYAVAIILSLFLGGIICSLVSRGDPFKFFSSLFKGCFGTERKFWLYMQEFAILLAVSMALVPAFKMKFWNLGANGQILMGGLASITCAYYLGGKIDDNLLLLICVVSSAVVGAIWAVIPAICKALWNTNESLFTLMMNYIASGLVTYFIALWVTGGSGILKPLAYGQLPQIGGKPYNLIILFGIIATIFMYIYLKHSKQGYEISVVGDSPNTARYIGINVKKVIIRTLIISGAISGLVGLLLTNGLSNTIGAQTANNRGFTAIMTTWLANCNPLFIIATCTLVTFVSKGMVQVRMDFGMTNDSISNLVVGVVYFFIIACAFFIQYKIVFNPTITAFFNKIKASIIKIFTKKENK